MWSVSKVCMTRLIGCGDFPVFIPQISAEN